MATVLPNCGPSNQNISFSLLEKILLVLLFGSISGRWVGWSREAGREDAQSKAREKSRLGTANENLPMKGTLTRPLSDPKGLLKSAAQLLVKELTFVSEPWQNTALSLRGSVHFVSFILLKPVWLSLLFLSLEFDCVMIINFHNHS